MLPHLGLDVGFGSALFADFSGFWRRKRRPDPSTLRNMDARKVVDTASETSACTRSIDSVSGFFFVTWSNAKNWHMHHACAYKVQTLTTEYRITEQQADRTPGP